MTDHALDALLAEYAPPSVPAGLAERVVAAALALPQEARPAGARPRHDRRNGWRRPTLIAGIALGVAVSGAVAATLAGIRLDRLPGVEAVLAAFADRESASASAPAPPAPAAKAPTVVDAAPVPPEPVVTPSAPEPPPPVHPSAVRAAAPPATAPVEVPREISESRRIEPPSPAPLPPAPPPPPARQAEAAPAPAVESRAAPPPADEQLRLQREQIERAERLRAARQAQIERLQRLQQSRERIRRLRRD